MKNKKWTKRRHAVTFAVLRPIMRLYFKLRYGYTAKRSGLPKGAYLIISNHQTTMDPFMLSVSFKFPVYFIASDDLFNLKVSPLIEYLVAPIPKSKSLQDIAAVKNIFRVIKEGGAVGVFPEGNRTISGGQWEMTDAIAKLAKSLKVPLVLYNIQGGYGTDPRWGHSIRRGKTKGFVKRVVSCDELKEMSVGQVFSLIKDELSVDDTSSGIRFRSRKRAEYIERALYLCPVCNGVSGIVSHKYKFRCKFCNTASTYTEKLSISPLYAGYERICEWFGWERKEIAKLVSEGLTVGDSDIIFRESVKLARKKKLPGSSVSIDKDKLVVGEVTYPLKDIDGLTMVGKKKFNFYYKNQILQVKGNRRFCAIKYVHIFDGLKEVEQ
ncbi:MAG: 1-acyl-sn-glycerol-3-phosphate acyltransferase [Clostridia bacterium]|nr:1-acyl-sn-glycerol-3-phosphate acyltransferase [Clostridia bacterium]